MKIKLVLIPFFIIFTFLFSYNIFAYAFRCSEVSRYCNYQGLFDNLEGAQEEYQMLTEPARHGNFQQMFLALLYIVDCAKENSDCMKALKNPNCNVSKYFQRLVNFYEEDNHIEITDELVIDMFEKFKQGEGAVFFSKDKKD